jgi:Fe-Mn family superoxide dismutase
LLGGAIRSEHGSLEQLKSNFSASALGMASSGWIWFVVDRRGHTGVIPTFGAGTLLVRSRTNMWKQGDTAQGEQILGGNGSLFGGNTGDSSATSTSVFSGPSTFHTSGLKYPQTPPNPPNLTRSFYNDSLTTPASSIYSSESIPQPEIPSRDDNIVVGEELCPLFCVSVHEHAWMSAGYGVWGKEEWLKKFWTVLDWGKVSRSFLSFNPDKQMF